MNSIERALRQAMTEHDREAPGAADLLRGLEDLAGAHGLAPPRRPVRWHMPLLAAAAVAAVIAGSLWAGGLLAGHRREVVGSNRSAQPSPLSCPARDAHPSPWVPAQPAGVDGGSRLVPRRVPTSALICAYAGTNFGRQSDWALSGRRVLAGGLPRLAAQLTWQPRELHGQSIMCTLIGGKQTNYLIGLTYSGGGTLWVGTNVNPNSCPVTFNGQFTSFGYIGSSAQRAFHSGRWPPEPPAACKGRTVSAGRLGQETAMVPPGSTSLLICPAGRVIGSGYGRLAAALNALPTRLSTRSCSERGPSRQQYQLLFSYPKGPPALVDIRTGCYPEIDSLSLQANSARSVLPIIKRLLRSG